MISGTEQNLYFHCVNMPLDACFVIAFPTETPSLFRGVRNRALAYFEGVPQTILYDNTPIAVAQITVMVNVSRRVDLAPRPDDTAQKTFRSQQYISSLHSILETEWWRARR
jgi:hypothetical protein